jgi:alpha-galactosidase
MKERQSSNSFSRRALLQLAGLLAVSPVARQSNRPHELHRGATWGPAWAELVDGHSDVPRFSFVYGGRHSADLLPAWERRDGETVASTGCFRRTVTYRDPTTAIEVACELTAFTGYPALDWVLRFRNTGSQDTPILEQVLPLAIHVVLASQAPVVLHHSKGSEAEIDDFRPLVTPLIAGRAVVLAPHGGRSSNGCFPYFNLAWGDAGLLGAIGWSGQWQLCVERLEGGEVALKAGQQTLRLVLRPGESIRTPRILLLGWQGDRIEGHNQLRRLIYEHYTPTIAGQKPLPHVRFHPFFAFRDGSQQDVGKYLTIVRTFAPLGCELVDICAGWSGGGYAKEDTNPGWLGWERNVGTWVPRPDSFPRGLRPIGVAAHEAGVKISLWLDPERAFSGSQLDRENPDWLLRAPALVRENAAGSFYLVNFGLTVVQDWAIDLISQFIEKVPLDCIIYDFNIDPLPFWQRADGADRSGITEIRCVEGYYRVLDAIRARYPGVIIDCVASGGRRMDLESLSRCHTYWNSDCYFNPLANQGFVHGVSLYLPGNYVGAGGVGEMGDDPFAFRTMLPGVANCLWNPWDPKFPGHEAAHRAHIAEMKRLRYLGVGDFYPLLPRSTDPDGWNAYQFHRADLDRGMVLAFRNDQSEQEVADLSLRGVSPSRIYDLTLNDGRTERISGAKLIRALRVSISRQPGSYLLTYGPARS